MENGEHDNNTGSNGHENIQADELDDPILNQKIEELAELRAITTMLCGRMKMWYEQQSEKDQQLFDSFGTKVGASTIAMCFSKTQLKAMSDDEISRLQGAFSMVFSIGFEAATSNYIQKHFGNTKLSKSELW